MSNRALLFSHRLRELCELKRSASAVARDLGINRQQFARYLNGSTMPRDGVVSKIARYFDIPEEALFTAPQQLGPESEGLADITMESLTGLLSDSNREAISEEELPSGFYLQFKKSLALENKYIIFLARIYREKGIVKFRRRTSAKVVRGLPGSVVTTLALGTFFKSSGNLILIARSTSVKVLTFHSFKSTSAFNSDIKPGIHLSIGIGNGMAAAAALTFLQRIPPEVNVLEYARRQGVVEFHQLSDTEQYFLGGNKVGIGNWVNVP